MSNFLGSLHFLTPYILRPYRDYVLGVTSITFRNVRYFPDSPSKKAATDNLTRAINRCTPLLDELKWLPGGYNVREKTYTPQQTHLIYKYLGEP